MDLKKITPKKILVWSLFIVLFALIVVLTFVPVIFDIENLDVQVWITNALINIGIMIGSIILGEIFGEDKQKEKANGLFQTALDKFEITLKEIVDKNIHIYFSQFYIWFKAKELLKKKEGYLVDNGISQLLAHLIVEYCNKDDIENMRNHVVIKTDKRTNQEIKFRVIHEDEYQVIKDIFSTDFNIDAPEYTYYLSAFGDSSSQSTLEQAKVIEKKEHSNKTFNRTFKIALSLFISIIWGMATVSDATYSPKTMFINFFSRMLALFGGLLSGYLTSVVAIKLGAQKLDNKTQVLGFYKAYYEKGEFTPKTYEQIVEEEMQSEKGFVKTEDDVEIKNR